MIEPFSRVMIGDCVKHLKTLPADSVHCVGTSPPYFGLRSYWGLTPSIWCGDAQCHHDFKADGRAIDQRRLYLDQGKHSYIEKSVQTAVSGGDTCTKCGAWSGCLGNEPTIQMYVDHIVEVFREVWRVLHPTGVVFLNIGDSYANDTKWGGKSTGKHQQYLNGGEAFRAKRETGTKPGDLCGIPWRVALALQADGWYLRSEVIWHKKTAMPSSVGTTHYERCRVKVSSANGNDGGYAQNSHKYPQTGLVGHSGYNIVNGAEWQDCPGCDKCRDNDGLILSRGTWRPTVAHEAIYMLTKSGDYYGDQEAVRTKLSETATAREKYTRANGKARQGAISHTRESNSSKGGANLRSVWRMASAGRKYEYFACCNELVIGGRCKKLKREAVDGVKRPCCPKCGDHSRWIAHFATFPLALVTTMLKAGTSAGGVCPKCLTPWVRVIDKEQRFYGHSATADRMSFSDIRESGKFAGFYKSTAHRNLKAGPTVATTTTTFRALCDCGCAEPVPATAMDIFLGSGTTGIAAKLLGLNFIGTEGSTDYGGLAIARIDNAREFVRKKRSKPAPEPDKNQMSLF